jgi:hypothetical protein
MRATNKVFDSESESERGYRPQRLAGNDSLIAERGSVKIFVVEEVIYVDLQRELFVLEEGHLNVDSFLRFIKVPFQVVESKPHALDVPA